MEGKLQTSFIPKRPIVETKIHNAPSTNIFSAIAWFVFIVVAVASVGVYFYGQYLTKSISSKNAELTNIINQFNNNSISHFSQLDAKLKAATTILDSHSAFSYLLGLIGSNTLQSVQWVNLNYSFNSSGSDTLLSLKGIAPDFTSVALQSDRLLGLTYFKNQNFGSISLNEDGSISFSYSTGVQPSSFKYGLTLKSDTVPQEVSSATSTEASN